MIFSDLVEQKEIVLSDMDLCDDDLDVLSEVLLKSKVVEEICLSHNRLDLSSGNLTDAVATSNTLRVIRLDHNKIAADGTKRLAAALKLNQSLKKIVLDDNLLGDRETKILARAFMVNTSLEEISLENNKISCRGAQSLAECMKENKSVNAIGLLGNKIGSEGAQQLVKALNNNCNIRSLRLADPNGKVNEEIQTILDDPGRKMKRLQLEIAEKDAIIAAKDGEISSKNAEISSLKSKIESFKKILAVASNGERASVVEVETMIRDSQPTADEEMNALKEYFHL